MDEIKVSQLDAVDEVRDTDVIMEISGGANKKATIQQVKDNIVKDEYGTSDNSSYAQSYQNEHNVIVSSTQPTTSERVWFKQSKNLFSSALELGTFSNDGVKSASTTNYRNSTPIAVQPNTTYTFSINGVSQKYGIYYYNNTNTFINSEGLTTGTFTTPANCYYINFRCFNADFTSDYASLKLQIELGDTATSYEAYINPSIIIDDRTIYNKEQWESVNYTDYISFNSSVTTINSCSAIKKGNQLIINYDIVISLIEGTNAIGNVLKKLLVTSWSSGRYGNSSTGVNNPATIQAISNGAINLYTSSTGSRSAGQIILYLD